MCLCTGTMCTGTMCSCKKDDAVPCTICGHTIAGIHHPPVKVGSLLICGVEPLPKRAAKGITCCCQVQAPVLALHLAANIYPLPEHDSLTLVSPSGQVNRKEPNVDFSLPNLHVSCMQHATENVSQQGGRQDKKAVRTQDHQASEMCRPCGQNLQ